MSNFWSSAFQKVVLASLLMTLAATVQELPTSIKSNLVISNSKPVQFTDSIHCMSFFIISKTVG